MDDVAISVICTNNAAVLEGCLEALPAACEGVKWRATVIDNASTDGTSDLVRERFRWAELIRNERRRGFSHNHNLVLVPTLRSRDARYVMILNDDTRFDPGAVAAMVEEMDAQPRVGALGPRIRGAGGAPQQSLFPFLPVRSRVLQQFRPAADFGTASESGWLNGSCVMVRTAAVEEIGPLDERYFIFFEDIDLGRRLEDAGWRSALSARAGMVHLEHQTISMPALNSVMARQMLRSEWLYMERHHGRGGAVTLVAASRLALALRCAKAAVRAALGDQEARIMARNLLTLCVYKPTEPLPHEASPG
jgi:N-acetylglucosaminyl-diphospho-decaprenol L-rhamnosyltransferase